MYVVAVELIKSEQVKANGGNFSPAGIIKPRPLRQRASQSCSWFLCIETAPDKAWSESIRAWMDSVKGKLADARVIGVEGIEPKYARALRYLCAPA
jgi:hypothetical protein